jgi:hypothetical protein
MALPKIQHKLHEHYLTGLKKKIKFRAFTVAEQKILLQTKEEIGDKEPTTGHNPDTILAVSQIIENCTLGKINPDELCTFDLEDLFLRLRSKSVGEKFNVRYAEHYVDEEGRPQTNFINIHINLDEVKVIENPDHKNTINVTDDIGVIMRYPTFKMLSECKTSDDLAKACIETIFTPTEMHETNIAPKGEIDEFYDSIETIPMQEIKKFFDTMPKLRHTVEVTLRDGRKETIVFEGLESFFT